MERSNKRPKDKDVNDVIEHIYANGLGNINVRTDAAPTVATMKANTMEFFNDELFLKLANGKSYKFSVTEIS